MKGLAPWGSPRYYAEMRRLAAVQYPVILALVILLIGLKVLGATRALAAMPCRAEDTFPGWVIVAFAVLSFWLGGIAGRLRNLGSEEVDRNGPGALSSTHVHRALSNALVIHGLLALFFLSVTLVLAYETIGLWNVDLGHAGGPQPITYYVRCAKTVDPFSTTVAACAVAFLAGHWLWFGAGREHP